jgi:hypothetical protein
LSLAPRRTTVKSDASESRPYLITLSRANSPESVPNATLPRMSDSSARFFAVPVKVKGMGTFPVRAFARV